MNHQTFNKKSYGFLLYFTFQGLLTPLLSAFIPYYIELLSILLQNYNPVATKTDIGRRKDEEGRLNCRWNTICILHEVLWKTKKNSLHKQKYRRISVYKLTAQQVDDERTTADMQAHNSCCAVHDSILHNDRYYICQQLILYIPTTYSGSFNTHVHGYWWLLL